MLSTALVMLLLIGIASVSVSHLILTQSRSNASGLRAQQAYYAAQAGLDYAIIQGIGLYPYAVSGGPSAWQYPILNGYLAADLVNPNSSGEITNIYYNYQGSFMQIKATGTSQGGDISRTVCVNIAEKNGTTAIVPGSWRDSGC